MPAYVISMMRIEDPETYRKYTNLTPPLVKNTGVNSSPGAKK